jgi:hypothetical protein
VEICVNPWLSDSKLARLIPFEILNSFLVLFGGGFGFERAEIAAFVRLRIFLSRIQTVTAFNFSDHDDFAAARGTPTQILPSRVSTLNVFRSTLAGP